MWVKSRASLLLRSGCGRCLSWTDTCEEHSALLVYFKWVPLVYSTSLPARPLNHALYNRTVWTLGWPESRRGGHRGFAFNLSLTHQTSRTRDMRSLAAIEFHTLRLAQGLTERYKRCIPLRAGANHSTCISYTVLVVKRVRRGAPDRSTFMWKAV